MNAVGFFIVVYPVWYSKGSAMCYSNSHQSTSDTCTSIKHCSTVDCTTVRKGDATQSTRLPYRTQLAPLLRQLITDRRFLVHALQTFSSH